MRTCVEAALFAAHPFAATDAQPWRALMSSERGRLAAGGARGDGAAAPRIDLARVTNRVQVVDPSAALDAQTGFRCEVCEASFRSYDAYLDHLNGRLHQRNTGTAAAVERVDDVERIRARIALLRERRAQAAGRTHQDPGQILEERLQQRQAEEEAQRREKYAKKRERRAKTRADGGDALDGDGDADADADEAAAMAAVLGIKGFG